MPLWTHFLMLNQLHVSEIEVFGRDVPIFLYVLLDLLCLQFVKDFCIYIRSRDIALQFSVLVMSLSNVFHKFVFSWNHIEAYSWSFGSLFIKVPWSQFRVHNFSLPFRFTMTLRILKGIEELCSSSKQENRSLEEELLIFMPLKFLPRAVFIHP